MIKFKINDQSINVPTCWEDLTFSQYMRVLALKDDTIELISIFTGLEHEYLRSARIVGLKELLEVTKFLRVQIDTDKLLPPASILGIKLPTTIQLESLGQFEDMRKIMVSGHGADLVQFLENYGKYVAIYVQKERDGSYNYQKAQDLIPEIMQAPALEVMGAGGFFYVTLLSLLTGTNPSSQKVPPAPKKKKPVTQSSKKRSVRTRR